MNNNENEISFIICTNDELYLEECRFYISHLMVPDEMNVSVISVSDAKSMAAGYNEAMRATGAKYKVYLHQDMFILNRRFILDILNVFRTDESIGAIGVAGAKRIPIDGRVWDALDLGGCYSIGSFSDVGYRAVKPDVECPIEKPEEAEYLDGMLIATSHDIDWDESIGGFHFYDVTQSINLRERGWKTVVVPQKEIWCFHDFGPLNLGTYDCYRKKFCECYPVYSYSFETDNTRIYDMCEKIASVLKDKFRMRQFDEIESILTDVGNAVYFNQDLIYVLLFMEIIRLESSFGLIKFSSYSGENDLFYSRVYDYQKIKFLLIRIMFGYEEIEKIAELVINGLYSPLAVAVVFLHSVPQDYSNLWYEIGKYISESGVITSDVWMNILECIQEYEENNMPSADGL